MSSPSRSPEILPREATWAALLGQWLDFARASVALPEDAEGQRRRASVAPIINLQAVTYALAELPGLPPDERALGLDRAEILIRRSVESLSRIWREEPMRPLLMELIRDAWAALRSAEAGLVVELSLPAIVGDEQPPDPFVTPELAAEIEDLRRVGFGGDLRIALPGTLLVPGEPVAHIIGIDGEAMPELHGEVNGPWRRFAAALEPAVAHIVAFPRQVYRRLDDQGRIVEDHIRPLSDEPEAGRPLLVTVIERGDPLPAPSDDPGAWIDRQRKALPDNGLRVVISESG